MLTLDRFKLYAHIDHADEDELIESLIRAADTAVRDMTGKEPPSDSDELFDTAVLQLTAHWYENRTPVTDTSVTQVPFTSPCPAATRKRRAQMALTNDLRHRLTVFNKHQTENDIGETCWQYTEDGKIWGALTVMSGRNETLPGDTVRAEVTHKLTIRPRSCRLTTATYFVYEGQRYDVLYWQPHYKRRDRLEVMLKLVVEDA